MISVVLPVHNEADVLTSLYARLCAAAVDSFDDFEVIVVDDGSNDGTSAILASIHQCDPRWKVLTFSRNFGHQLAVSAGIHYAQGDAVVVMDADLQDPPELLGELVARWREGYQVVYAVRASRAESTFKRLAYAGFYRILRRVSAIEIPLDAGDFCLMDRAVVNVLRAMPERSRFVRGLRAWAGFRQTSVSYSRPARAAGRPKYTLPKLLALAADGFLSFSSLPLRLSSWLGMTLCASSALLLTLIVGWRMSNLVILGMHPSQGIGWTSLCSLILFVSGLQMLVIGIIGEYLARIFHEVKGRPPWIIAQSLGIEPASDPVGWFVADAYRQVKQTRLRPLDAASLRQLSAR